MNDLNEPLRRSVVVNGGVAAFAGSGVPYDGTGVAAVAGARRFIDRHRPLAGPRAADRAVPACAVSVWPAAFIAGSVSAVLVPSVGWGVSDLPRRPG